MAMLRRFLVLFALLLTICASNSLVNADKADKAPAQKTQARARHILVDTEEEIDAIIEELDSVNDVTKRFMAIAKEKSKCPSGKNGGDLGWFNRGAMVPEFDRVVFELPMHKVHKVKTQFGWHVVYTIELGEDDHSTYHMTVYYLNKAMPFVTPLLLIAIMFYGNSRTIKINGPRARASHILVKTETEADELLKQIKESAEPKKTLAELAKAKSSCPSKSKGGDLGLFAKGQMVPAFEKIAFEKDVDSIHKVQTQFGWHVIMVTDRIGEQFGQKKNN